jgi:transcriptional regulator with XRE-family HTH domain
MPEFSANVATNIRTARRSRGHTQRSLAAALDVSERTVVNWESGHRLPNRTHLERLAAELEQTPAWFYATHEPDEVAAV